jgi:hypothetical protein
LLNHYGTARRLWLPSSMCSAPKKSGEGNHPMPLGNLRLHVDS